MLISFVGKARKAEGGIGVRDYTKASYQMPDNSIVKTSFFGNALIKYFQENKHCENPEHWIIFGTETSSWDSLLDIFSNEDNDSLLAVFDKIANESGSKQKLQESLTQGLSPLLEEELGIKSVKLIVIDNLKTEEGHKDFQQILINEIPDNSNITLDVTHAYRHIPIITSFFLSALHWLKNTRIRGMYYGALDMTNESITPVINLQICADTANIASDLSTYKQTGNFLGLGNHCSGSTKAINAVSFFEDVNNLREARKPTKKLKKSLADESKDFSPFLSASLDQVASSFEWADENKLPERMIEKAKFFLKQNDYIKATILIFEAIHIYHHPKGKDSASYDESMRKEAMENITLALRSMKKPSENTKLYNDFRAFRNAIVHTTKPKNGRVTEALKDRTACNNLFKEMFSLAEELMRG